MLSPVQTAGIRAHLERAARPIPGIQYAMTGADEVRFEHPLVYERLIGVGHEFLTTKP